MFNRHFLALLVVGCFCLGVEGGPWKNVDQAQTTHVKKNSSWRKDNLQFDLVVTDPAARTEIKKIFGRQQPEGRAKGNAARGNFILRCEDSLGRFNCQAYLYDEREAAFNTVLDELYSGDTQ